MKKKLSTLPPSSPPEAWRPLFRLARMASGPFERFFRIEAASGIVLLLAAAIALIWANSRWADSYHHLLHMPIVLSFGPYAFAQTVHFWVNDILMVVFFFVVGLEVRREMYAGELSSLRRALLPVSAAVGGMLLPAAIYLSINLGSPALKGWGVPMATDIAFAVGVLALLGRRIPPAIRVMLLALAIIDDIGAILVIALFYSSGIAMQGLLVVGLGLALLFGMRWMGVRNPFYYLAPGVVMWAGTLQAGIHPTIAGVLLGMLTPVRSWFGREGFLAVTEKAITNLRRSEKAEGDSHEILIDLEKIRIANREAIPPVVRIEAALHPWVAFAIMPLFALANAGVALGSLSDLPADGMGILSGIGLGLLIGKPLGIVLFSWLAVRLGIAALPEGTSWSGVLVVGCVAGIGFTMALFIGVLAFEDPLMLATAKLGVLGASLLAGIVGLLVGFTLPKSKEEKTLPSHPEVEASLTPET